MATIALTAVPPVVWGSTYAVTQLWLPPDRPLFAATARVLPAGLLLLLWVRRLPRGRWWGRSVVLGRPEPRAVLRPALPRRLPPAERAGVHAHRPVAAGRHGRGLPRASASGRRGSPSSRRSSGSPGVVTLVWQNDRAGTVDAVGVAAARRGRRVVRARLRARQALVAARRRARHDVVAAGRRRAPAAAGGRRGGGRPAGPRRPGRRCAGSTSAWSARRWATCSGSAGSPGWMPVPSPSWASSTRSSARRWACCCSPSRSARCTWSPWRSPSAACCWRRPRCAAASRPVAGRHPERCPPAPVRGGRRRPTPTVGPCPT